MNQYFDEICETMECDPFDFNMPLLEKICITSIEDAIDTAFIIEGSALTSVRTDFSDTKIIVLPMFGRNSDSVGDVDSDFWCEVRPRPDGTRVPCILLADESVALTSNAPHWADMTRNDEFHLLWLFDDEALLSTHVLSADFYDDLSMADAIAEDHNPLTAEEVQAWQRVAAQASLIEIFDYVDFCSE
ncbi:hypothetical protein [Paraburkholderia tropica]|uniref:hypothetical protein n=1 Tax=Paraburkholderia tropica TaxID=92647 RepID=UPI001590E069|nr:hypothetical protein [Paraburkholderia tropica]